MLKLVPLVSKELEREFSFLTELNADTLEAREAALKQIQQTDLEKLIKIRERSLIFSLKNLTEISRKLLAESFAFTNLQVKQITWGDGNSTKVYEYIRANDRVRPVRNLSELQKRLEGDFRCYGVFHKQIQTPVSFVYIRLYNGLAENLPDLLTSEPPEPRNSCVFYSISSPVRGLNGIEFGGKLIKTVKQVIEEEQPQIKIFATFSPIPNFTGWLAKQSPLYDDLMHLSREQVLEKKEQLMEVMQKYLDRKNTIDPVARFHFRNGATSGPIRFAADPNPVSFRQSYGIQVNYIYSQ